MEAPTYLPQRSLRHSSDLASELDLGQSGYRLSIHNRTPAAAHRRRSRSPFAKKALVIIRRETLEDRAAVDAVTSAAFGRPEVDGEPVETRLLRALRDDAGWISTLSMVAERDDEIIGHVVWTRGRVGILDALGLGPISVLPIRQRQVPARRSCTPSSSRPTPPASPFVIALLGDPRFYIRFGFVPASELGVDAPDPAWAEHFQVRTLTDCPPLVAGAFRYAAPFADI
jgi:putative acetyltransferase